MSAFILGAIAGLSLLLLSCALYNICNMWIDSRIWAHKRLKIHATTINELIDKVERLESQTNKKTTSR